MFGTSNLRSSDNSFSCLFQPL